MRRNCKSTLITLQNLSFAYIAPIQRIYFPLILHFPEIQSQHPQKGNYCLKTNLSRIIFNYPAQVNQDLLIFAILLKDF